MTVRVLIAAVVAGFLMFFAGAIEHMALPWGDRTMLAPPNEARLADFIKSQNLSRGLYTFPPERLDVPAGERDRAWEELNAKYKAGPNGMLLVGPTGEDMMGPKQLGGEFASNVIAALFAAWIVSLLRPDTPFAKRWVVVRLIGISAWLSQNLSYHLWYRFPAELTRDELFCVLLEWGLAGLAIAAIVKSPTCCAMTPTATSTANPA